MKRSGVLLWAYTVVTIVVVVLVEAAYDIPVHGHIDYAWCIWCLGCVVGCQWDYWRNP
jgi:hypothetical protein